MSVARGREYVLTPSCPDKPGIVYAVSSFPVQHSADILARRQYGESPDGRFFLRVRCSVPARDAQLAQDRQLARLAHGFSWAAEAFHMSRQPLDKAARVRTPIMVSWLGCPVSRPTGQESLRRR